MMKLVYKILVTEFWKQTLSYSQILGLAAIVALVEKLSSLLHSIWLYSGFKTLKKAM